MRGPQTKLNIAGNEVTYSFPSATATLPIYSDPIVIEAVTVYLVVIKHAKHIALQDIAQQV